MTCFDTRAGRDQPPLVLKEIPNVKQERGSGRRRWFESEGFDFVVWQDKAGRCEGFQLCYDLGGGEHALTWRPDRGFAHSTVDQGDDWQGGGKQSPILIPDGEVPWAELARLWAERSTALEPAVREMVSARIVARA